MLRLANGTTYQGNLDIPSSIYRPDQLIGEVVFFTGMTGYEEALTDPSYAGQILVFTFPSIGIYGWSDEHAESSRIWVKGVVARAMQPGLRDHLKSKGIPVMTGVDTRRLVLTLREEHTMVGYMGPTYADPETEADETEARVPDDQAYRARMKTVVAEVSTKVAHTELKKVGPAIAVVDLGMKLAQISCLEKVFSHPVVGKVFHLLIVPYDTDLVELASTVHLSGVFLSNGPGDPGDLKDTTIASLRAVMARLPSLPIFGICLGHQVLALAAGGQTYKLPYGNRGANLPVGFSPTIPELCADHAFITSQNHGYAVDPSTLDETWTPLFVNLNDRSNEGLLSKTHPWFSVQFHPEAHGGPRDTVWLFETFRRLVDEAYSQGRNTPISPLAALLHTKPALHLGLPLSAPPAYRKVLILGSGGLSIGQAGEFDYSGSQAIKAFKATGLTTVIMNPNVATIQTTADGHLADKVYSLPVTPEWVIQVIEKEAPDCIAVSFGGQTALNCAVALADYLEEHSVEVLGTPLEAIRVTEDREAFKALVEAQGAACARSISLAPGVDPAEAAESLGYPVLVRSGFALGGLGSGFASGPEELAKILATNASSDSIIMDKSLKGWVEVEFEVVRDGYGNAITVCSMENFDPVGVHTGESIVVAPCLTLDDATIQRLRSLALTMAHAIGIVGECNIQYAVNPKDFSQVYIIEVNARLSRSSALASKATGYPLAYVAAMLGLGYSLPSLTNLVTGTTTSMFEPSLDYCVVKMPRWDLTKFEHAESTIGTAMKSVGEVMAIGATFEEALMKAVRMVEDGPVEDLGWLIDGAEGGEEPIEDLPPAGPGPRQIQRLMAHLSRGNPVDTGISPYFLDCLCRVGGGIEELRAGGLTEETVGQAKRLGLSDLQVAYYTGSTEAKVFAFRVSHSIFPSLFEVDTVAGEFACQTSYLYLTYHAAPPPKARDRDSLVLVLGSGTYRIGSSVEFDWCAVNCVRELCEIYSFKSKDLNRLTPIEAKVQRDKVSVGMLNFNPETVSTDFDEADCLIFDEISLETARALGHLFDLKGLVVSVGGQTPNNLAMSLYHDGFPILGTHPEMIDQAENRFKFSRLLESIGVDQPAWCQLTSVEEAFEFSSSVGYPVLVRPSYVLSGAAMRVVFGPEELELVVTQASEISKDKPVVISKFIIDAKEIEVDAVAVEGTVVHLAVSEHIENAGVHSGDATLVFPPQDLTSATLAKVHASTRAIGKALSISGPYNIQFVAKDDEIRVIECNLRSSRSFPFVSKVGGINLIREATKAMVLRNDASFAEPLDPAALRGIGVKAPVFSFRRLPGADCVLGVEMRSTGEVACLGSTMGEAYLKALEGSTLPISRLFSENQGVGPHQRPSILLSIGSHANKVEMAEAVKALLEAGYHLSATPGTASFYNNVFTGLPKKVIERVGWSVIDSHLDTCDFVLNISMLDRTKMTTDVRSQGYHLRRMCIEKGVGMLTDIKAAKAFVAALVASARIKPRLNPLLDCQTAYSLERLPGLIDAHVHIREPGDTYKGDWDTETRAALAGGITTVLVMPNTRPPIDRPVHLDMVVEAATAKAHCAWGVYLGGTATNQEDILTMLSGPHASKIVGMKLYLDETYSGPLDLGHSWGAVAEHFRSWSQAAITKPIVVHTEADNFMRVLGLMALYPTVRVHVAHVHSRRLLDLVRGAKAGGMALTCEATPHHLFMDKPVEVDGESRGVKPPIGGDAAYLRENLDLIDCFATDHAPHLASEKCCPGYPGLETAVALLMQLDGGLEMLREKMYEAPCRIFGLSPPSSQVTVRTDCPWTFSSSSAQSRCGWSPFDGEVFHSRVTGVVLEGVTKVVDGRLVDRSVMGDFSVSSQESPRRPPPTKPSPAKPDLVQEPAILPSTIDEMTDRSKPLALSTYGIRSVMTAKVFSKEALRALFDRATYLRAEDLKGSPPRTLAGKAVTLLFLEPSTRTSTSFHRAATKMGASVMQVSPSTSSLTKGESLQDTLRCLTISSDLVVLRGADGCMKEARPLVDDGTIKCLVSGGDGTKEHPTQGLLDIFTIREELGSLYGLTIGLVGDMRHGRTIPSLLHLLTLYKVRQVYCIAPTELNLTETFAETLRSRGLPITLRQDLDEVMPSLDVLYMTRLQRERLSTGSLLSRMMTNTKSPYILDAALLSKAKPKMIVMHPLPRTDEISTEVDSDPRTVYFRQMVHGLYLRMALLEGLLT
jgi:carbamoyl-phosphate synthase/aspartate carbamoyltransferase/dihydroorotase